MDAGVVVVEKSTLDLQLFLEIGFKLIIYIINYWLIAEKNKYFKKIIISIFITIYPCYLSKELVQFSSLRSVSSSNIS